MKNNLLYIALIIVIVAAALYFLCYKNAPKSIESYGGPLRVTGKIPITSAYDICDQQYAWCLGDRPFASSDWCERKKYACRMEAYYSNVQRF